MYDHHYGRRYQHVSVQVGAALHVMYRYVTRMKHVNVSRDAFGSHAF